VTVRAVVINIHYHGATVRLADGTLAAVPSDEFAAHRPAYVAGYERRTELDLVLSRHGRYASVAFPKSGTEQNVPSEVPRLVDTAFEERIGEYLKATQEWAPADRPDPAERHFIRKKRRAAFFEARNKPT
jgi:hypothetical protein